MKVRIDAGGRIVEIECDGQNVSPSELADKVLATWQATDGAEKPSEGPAYGYASERRGPQQTAMTLGADYGRPMRETTA